MGSNEAAAPLKEGKLPWFLSGTREMGMDDANNMVELGVEEDGGGGLDAEADREATAEKLGPE